MTFADLFATLASRGVLPASRVKDLKTSLRYLAAALGAASLEQCHVGAACREEATWAEALETHFQQLTAQGRRLSAVTRRNTRNNLRVLLRQAEALGLLTAALPPRLLTTKLRRVRNEWRSTSLYPTSYRPQSGPRYFSLPVAQWPPDIVQGFAEYKMRCGLRIRETTFKKYETLLTIVLGYHAHICGRTPTWADVFDPAQLTAFIRWHAARVQRPLSAQGWSTACQLAAMAKVLAHPQARALADLRNALPMPEPVHDKRAHWVSLAQLEAVADTCLAEARKPFVAEPGLRNPGVLRVTKFQKGVLLKLLVRVPLRQRNLREMRLGKNLYQDQGGHWHLHLSGGELKIGQRQGRINTYHVDLTDYCPDFIPVLDEFLQAWRPKLPGATTAPFVFLTMRGKPFPDSALREELGFVVTRYTGKRFYPHLIRTIWATEYLQATQDFTTAATMLGDTLAIVMKTYYDIIHKDQHAKARAFLRTALHTG